MWWGNDIAYLRNLWLWYRGLERLHIKESKRLALWHITTGLVMWGSEMGGGSWWYDSGKEKFQVLWRSTPAKLRWGGGDTPTWEHNDWTAGDFGKQFRLEKLSVNKAHTIWNTFISPPAIFPVHCHCQEAILCYSNENQFQGGLVQKLVSQME